MINREGYLQKIRPFFNKDLVKVLTGIRRSGKSTLLPKFPTKISVDGPSDYYSQIILKKAYVLGVLLHET